MKITKIVILHFLLISATSITMDNSTKLPTQEDSPEYSALLELQQQVKDMDNLYLTMLLDEKTSNIEMNRVYNQLDAMKQQVKIKKSAIESWVAIQTIYYCREKKRNT